MNAIDWFEIPVLDLDRATRFYARTLDGELRREDAPGLPMALLPYKEPGVGGALVQHPQRKPSQEGATVYLGTRNLSAALGRLLEAGGAVVTPKTDIGPHGFIALFRDTEGNTIGLHQER